MWIGIVSLFPEMFDALNSGIIGRAQQAEQLQLQHWNPRDYSEDKHRRVDDRPYGGGPGMVMQYQPLKVAIDAAKAAAPGPSTTILLSPQGKVFRHQDAKLLASQEQLIFIAGRYEGIDQRVMHTIDHEYSIGDYVISGGELAAMVIIDAVMRLRPGVLGHEQSAEQDSFVNGLLDCPHYTRPEVIDEMAVPPVLLGGNHKDITQWRLEQALRKTLSVRPDLLESMTLDAETQALLTKIQNENCKE